MKFPKFITVIITITVCSILYVHQQTEIFRFAYTVQKNRSSLQDLLEKNTILRYNMVKNTSLTQLVRKVSESQDFQMPDTYRFVKSVYPAQNTRQQFNAGAKVFSHLFGVKRQAEAKTINPSISLRTDRN